MNNLKKHIQKIIDFETHAWNNKDAEALVSIFHPDMVWPWPEDENAHDPVDWIMPLGRYDRERWKSDWQKLFDTHDLIHNRRKTIKIQVSKQGDGAFAVVDIDTLWCNKAGRKNRWKGRVCKVYTKVEDEWKLIMHTGVLKYDK